MRKLLLSIFGIGLIGCSQVNISAYQNTAPKLDFKEYLSHNAKIKGSGIIQNRSGEVTKRFTFSGVTTWNGDDGVFHEKMVYTDGQIETREWQFHKISDNEYEATNPEVIGKATIKIAGNTMNWRYTMNVKVDNSVYKINFDDWMFLIDEKRIINRNYFTKFGYKVGELTLYLDKE